MLIALIQWFIDVGASICNGISNILPLSPFQYVSSIALSNDLMGAIAWLVPFPQIILLVQTWTVAIAVYYVSMVIMRWVKILS